MLYLLSVKEIIAHIYDSQGVGVSKYAVYNQAASTLFPSLLNARVCGNLLSMKGS